MKQLTILFTCISLMASSNAFAQQPGLNLGSKIAVGQAQMTTSFYNNRPDAAFNFKAGGSALYMFNAFVGGRADILVNYTSMSGKGEYTYSSVLGQQSGTFEEEINFFNLMVPLTLHLQLGTKRFHPYVDGGIVPTIQMFGTQSRTYDNADYNEDSGYQGTKLDGTNVFTFGTLVGAGISVENAAGNPYFLEFQWYNGMSPLGKRTTTNREGDYTMSQLNLAFGYFF